MTLISSESYYYYQILRHRLITHGKQVLPDNVLRRRLLPPNAAPLLQYLYPIIVGSEVAPLRKVINSSDPVDMPRPYKFGDWDPAYGQTGLGIIYMPRDFYYEGGIRKGKPHGTGRIGWTN